MFIEQGQKKKTYDPAGVVQHFGILLYKHAIRLGLMQKRTGLRIYEKKRNSLFISCLCNSASFR